MAGSRIPRYYNNGRYGSCDSTRLACTVEHDNVIGPHDNAELPRIVSHTFPLESRTDKLVLDTPHLPLPTYRHRQLCM